MMSSWIEYIFNYGNLGFGKAHNIAFEKVIDQSEFHLVLNPDVSFDTGTLEKIYAFMKAIKDVGLLLPKVYNENNELQYLAKLLPNPMDLIFRRFLPEYLLKTFKRHEEFELRSKNYDLPIEAPYLSGCFMFLRVEALREVGFFDPRFFMYMEDVDLSRRIHSRYRTVYFPEVMIVHGHEKASYKNFKLLKIHIISGIRYFNKYGWFFDAQRRKINNLCVRKKQDLNPFS